MLEQVEAVFNAVAQDLLVPVHQYLLLDDDKVYATNGRVWAAMPAALPGGAGRGPLLLNGEALRRAMGLPNVRASYEKDGELLVRHSRRSTVKLRSIDPAAFPLPPALDMEPVGLGDTERLRYALTSLLPFRGDAAMHPWSSGVYLDGERAIATNNQALAVMDVDCPVKLLIPLWVLEFVLGRPTMPSHVAATANLLHLQWPDGLQLTGRLLEDEFNAQAIRMAHALEDRLESAAIPLPQEWREAVERMAGFGVEHIKVGPEEMEGATTTAELVEGVGLPFAERRWTTALLLPALLLATHIDLSAPDGIGRWSGDRCRGLFAGRVA